MGPDQKGTKDLGPGRPRRWSVSVKDETNLVTMIDFLKSKTGKNAYQIHGQNVKARQENQSSEEALDNGA